jgi:hypothetical protein
VLGVRLDGDSAYKTHLRGSIEGCICISKPILTHPTLYLRAKIFPYRKFGQNFGSQKKFHLGIGLKIPQLANLAKISGTAIGDELF